MKKLGLLTVTLAGLMGLVACNKPAPAPVGPSYTVESAANAVCDKLNTVFELEGEDKISPTKDSDDEYYIVMNLGDGVTEDQLMAFVDQNLLIDDFAAKTTTWNQEEDEGIVFNFRDFQWEKVLLEYVVYERTGSENPGHDGMYLLIESLRSFKNWVDADDIEHYLDVKNGAIPEITIPEGGEYRWKFFAEGALSTDSARQLVGLFYFNCETAFDTAFKAAGWNYRSSLGGYFNEDATLFALLSYEPADAQYSEMTILQIFNVNDILE